MVWISCVEYIDLTIQRPWYRFSTHQTIRNNDSFKATFYIPGLGLLCKWAGGDGLPYLSRQSNYVGINATEKLKCPGADFPVLTDGA